MRDWMVSSLSIEPQLQSRPFSEVLDFHAGFLVYYPFVYLTPSISLFALVDFFATRFANIAFVWWLLGLLWGVKVLVSHVVLGGRNLLLCICWSYGFFSWMLPYIAFMDHSVKPRNWVYHFEPVVVLLRRKSPILAEHRHLLLILWLLEEAIIHFGVRVDKAAFG